MNTTSTVIPVRLTKTELANKYGTTWRSVKSIIHEILPEFEKSRRRILWPKEIREIYEEIGHPDGENYFNSNSHE